MNLPIRSQWLYLCLIALAFACSKSPETESPAPITGTGVDGTGSEIVTGNFVINSQQDLELFAGKGYHQINGSVYILQATDLSVVSELRIITENLSIDAEELTSTQGAFPALERVEGSIQISQNKALRELSGFPVLESTVDLSISNNASLESISGFPKLSRVSGTLLIDRNDRLASARGLSQLREVTGSLRLTNNPDLASLSAFSSLGTVGKNLEITSNPSLTRLDGLSAIMSVGGELTIESNSTLTDFCGLSNVSFGGSYVVNGNAYNPSESEFREDPGCRQ